MDKYKDKTSIQIYKLYYNIDHKIECKDTGYNKTIKIKICDISDFEMYGIDDNNLYKYLNKLILPIIDYIDYNKVFIS